MKRYFVSIFFIIFLTVTYNFSFAQGCSDAGFCSLGAMRPDQPFEKANKLHLRSIELSQYVGYTFFDDYIWATTIDASVVIGDKGSLQFKIPYMWIRGPLGTNQGLGDISLSYTYNLYSNYKGNQFNVTIGGKIPTNNSDQENTEGLPLPMYYQTSLGTYDFILGASFLTRKWLFALGYQHPFNINGNEFLWSRWEGHPLKAVSDLYPQARTLRRGNDFMIRVERNFRFSRLNFSLAYLGIYHLRNDEFQLTDGTVRISDDTEGLVQNGLLSAGYRFSTNSAVKFIFGIRLNERKKNPDGLSREWVSTIAYQYNF